MSKFCDNTMQSLQEAIAIEKGELLFCAGKGDRVYRQ